MPRCVCALFLALMLSSCSTDPKHATAEPRLGPMIDFVARELDVPRPANPGVWYVRNRELQSICRSDWACLAADQIYVREYCRAHLEVSICQFAVVHAAAHYVLRMAGTYTGRRQTEESIVHPLAYRWLEEWDRGIQSAAD